MPLPMRLTCLPSNRRRFAKITLAMTSSDRAAAEMASAVSPAAAIRNPMTATRVAP